MTAVSGMLRWHWAKDQQQEHHPYLCGSVHVTFWLWSCPNSQKLLHIDEMVHHMATVQPPDS